MGAVGVLIKEIRELLPLSAWEVTSETCPSINQEAASPQAPNSPVP